MRFLSSSPLRRHKRQSRRRVRRRATISYESGMSRRLLQFGPIVLVMLGFAAQNALAQDGERIREWQARQEAHREAAAAKRANGAGKGQPNERAMEGLPPKWVDKVRDMPPEQQQQFFANNAQFRQLPPARQQQVLQNLKKWNHLTPEQKEQARSGEEALERMSPEQREYVRNTLLPKWQALPQPRRQA